MTGPLWDDCSLDDADVSRLFWCCARSPCHAVLMPSNVKCDDEDRWRAGSTTHCIVEVLASFRYARARASRAGLMIDRVLVLWLAG